MYPLSVHITTYRLIHKLVKVRLSFNCPGSFNQLEKMSILFINF